MARYTVKWLIREHGLVGVIRKRLVLTTVADPSAPGPADLAKRDFAADRPNKLWMVDF